jgi:hypothetical protein
LADETGEIEEQGEGIANDGCFVSIGQAEEGGSLEVTAGLGGIAGFGIALATQAQLPGIRANGQVARPTNLPAVGCVLREDKAD